MGYGQLVWADPRDVRADPIRFQMVQEAPATPPPPDQVSSTAKIAEFMQQIVTPSLAVEPTKPKRPGRKSIGDLGKMAGIDHDV